MSTQGTRGEYSGAETLAPVVRLTWTSSPLTSTRCRRPARPPARPWSTATTIYWRPTSCGRESTRRTGAPGPCSRFSCALSARSRALTRLAALPPPPDSELHLIDFEYGCYNARGFDLGNHFNEWAGFECDYSRYPSDQQQRTFLVAYLEAAQEGARCASPSQEALDALVVEANVYALASHLYWAVWALLQAKYSAIDFDYLGYHSLRMAEARRRMPQVLPMVKPR